jgi:4-hydroxy-3-polyprenylbenzoate decarboxylase
MTRACESDVSPSSLRGLADFSYNVGDVGAAIASGSFKTRGMIIAPCSMRTLAEVATGVSSSLLTRAADVCLKERRRLVLLTRETPLHVVHLRNMLAVTEMGGIICPPVPAFYAEPHSIEDIIDQTVGRLLDLFEVESGLVHRWGEGHAIELMDDPVAAPRTEGAKVS